MGKIDRLTLGGQGPGESHAGSEDGLGGGDVHVDGFCYWTDWMEKSNVIQLLLWSKNERL